MGHGTFSFLEVLAVLAVLAVLGSS
ncbi:prepilin-type N-terminal cleavage/methylation domain-containing protein [Streptomyces sp. NBRC 109706]